MTEMNLRFDEVARAIRAGAVEGVADGAEDILDQSDDHVPFESGKLDRSGHVVTNGLEAAVVYDTDYAVVVHEDLTANHDPGKTAKFLENAGNNQARKVPDAVANRIRRKLGN